MEKNTESRINKSFYKNEVGQDWVENARRIGLYHLTVCIGEKAPSVFHWLKVPGLRNDIVIGIKHLAGDAIVREKLEKLNTSLDDVAYILVRYLMPNNEAEFFVESRRIRTKFDRKLERLNLTKKLRLLLLLPDEINQAGKYYTGFRNTPIDAKEHRDTFRRLEKSLEGIAVDVKRVIEDLKLNFHEYRGINEISNEKNTSGRKVDLVKQMITTSLRNYLAFKTDSKSTTKNSSLIARILSDFGILITRSNLRRDLEKIAVPNFSERKALEDSEYEYLMNAIKKTFPNINESRIPKFNFHHCIDI
ncbi:MAG: hypothetical protein ACKVQC_01115 [Elusimicrobiota bacterium]